MDLDEIETPALIVDRTKLHRNAQRMADRVARSGATLRPHLKTTKSIDLARAILDERVHGITVSTLKEVEYFFDNGIDDILYSVGVVPRKLPRVAKLLCRGADVKLLADDVAVVRSIAAMGVELGVEFSLLVEIDCDGHRSGIRADDNQLLEVARAIHDSEGTVLRGVMTHAGGSYNSSSAEEIRQYARDERAAVMLAAERLQQDGMPCDTISIGSTPTATFADTFDGVTEVRAGVYLFQDLTQVNLEVCDIDDIALSVLTTVIGHNRQSGRVITDAGMLALSLDHSTGDQVIDFGYGQVCDIDGKPQPGIVVQGVNQEHGIIGSTNGIVDFDEFPIGCQLRVLPNHACTMAAAHDRYHVVDNERRVTAVWHRINGW